MEAQISKTLLFVLLVLLRKGTKKTSRTKNKYRTFSRIPEPRLQLTQCRNAS